MVRIDGRLGRTLSAVSLALVATVVAGGCASDDEALKPSTVVARPVEAMPPAGAPPDDPDGHDDDPVQVEVLGPDVTRHDHVLLRGTVWPADSKVRVDGRRAEVDGTRWERGVDLARAGQNVYRVVATRGGRAEAATWAVVTREP